MGFNSGFKGLIGTEIYTTYRTRDQNGTDTVRTNGCVNSCVNSPEDGPVGPKHVEIRQHKNKIKTVTSVGLSFLMLKRCTVQ